MPRAKKKIPISFAKGEAKFAITESDWQRLERAYSGQSIPPEVRNAVLEVTRTFLYREALEQAARPISEAVKSVESWREGADEFLRWFPTRRDASNARTYAKSTLKQYWSHGLSSDPFEETAELVASFRSACETALTDLACEVEGDDGKDVFKNGEAWREWLGDLKQIFRNAGLRATARNDTPDTGKHSPFVELVWELQDGLPTAKRYTHTEVGLAQAIRRASSKPDHE